MYLKQKPNTTSFETQLIMLPKPNKVAEMLKANQTESKADNKEVTKQTPQDGLEHDSNILF